jgi:hypothetical protein
MYTIITHILMDSWNHLMETQNKISQKIVKLYRNEQQNVKYKL